MENPFLLGYQFVVNLEDETAGGIASSVPFGGKPFLVDFVHSMATIHPASSDIQNHRHNKGATIPRVSAGKGETNWK